MRFVPTLTALSLALLASGCAAFSDDSAADDGEVRVAAAFYPLAFVAERVGGDHADVELLTAPGTEPHDLELGVAQVAEVSKADLVVYETGFQASVDAAVQESATGTTLDVADVVDLLTADHSEEEHSDDDHDEESGEDEHDHGELDPHFWLDPARVAELATAVGDDLAEIDPDHADDYRANAAALVEDLTTLDEDYTSGLADCDRDTIVVSHDAFSYLEKYGVHVAAIAGLSPDAEPTPADLAELQELIGSDGITTVFGERLAPQQLTDSLAKDAGVTTEVLDPIEGLTADTADEDYLSLMRSNLSALESANGCA